MRESTTRRKVESVPTKAEGHRVREIAAYRPAAGRLRSQQGAALLVSIMMLTIMGLIGLGSMELATRDRQVAGFMARARSALYAADAGVSWGQSIIDQQVGLLVSQGVSALFDFDPAFPSEASPHLLGDGSGSQPRFMQDTNAGVNQAVDYLSMGEACDGWIMSDEFGGSQWREALFRINVEGRVAGTGGSATHVEASAGYCYPYQ